MSAKKSLLNWVSNRAIEYDVKVTNFTTDFSDGLAFCSVVCSLDSSNKINFSKLDSKNVTKNLTLAFDTAFNLFQIPKLLDPEDITDFDVPDEKIVMMYLMLFYQYYTRNKSNMVNTRLKLLNKKEKKKKMKLTKRYANESFDAEAAEKKAVKKKPVKEKKTTAAPKRMGKTLAQKRKEKKRKELEKRKKEIEAEKKRLIAKKNEIRDKMNDEFKLEEVLSLKKELEEEEERLRYPEFGQILLSYGFHHNREKVIVELESLFEGKTNKSPNFCYVGIILLAQLYQEKEMNKDALKILQECLIDYDQKGSMSELDQRAQAKVFFQLSKVELTLYEILKSNFAIKTEEYFTKDSDIKKIYKKNRKRVDKEQEECVYYERLYNILCSDKLIKKDQTIEDLLLKKNKKLMKIMKLLENAKKYSKSKVVKILVDLALVYDELNLFSESWAIWENLIKSQENIEEIVNLYINSMKKSLSNVKMINYLQVNRKTFRSSSLFLELSKLKQIIKRKNRKEYYKMYEFYNWVPSFCKNLKYSEENYKIFCNISKTKRVSTKAIKIWIQEKSVTIQEFLIAYILNCSKVYVQKLDKSVKRNLTILFSYFYFTLDNHIMILLIRLLEKVILENKFIVRNLIKILLPLCEKEDSENSVFLKKKLFRIIIQVLPKDDEELFVTQAIVELKNEKAIEYFRLAITYSQEFFVRYQCILGLSIFTTIFKKHEKESVKLLKICSGETDDKMRIYAFAGLYMITKDFKYLNKVFRSDPNLIDTEVWIFLTKSCVIRIDEYVTDNKLLKEIQKELDEGNDLKFYSLSGEL